MAKATTQSILIIEDEPLISAMYTDVLTRRKYAVDQALNKSGAIEKLSATPPKLILLDLLIPLGPGEELVTYDHPVGFDILEWLQHHPEYKETKILVVTNLDADLHREHAQKLGAHDYLVKADYEPQQIAQRVDALLTRSVT